MGDKAGCVPVWAPICWSRAELPVYAAILGAAAHAPVEFSFIIFIIAGIISGVVVSNSIDISSTSCLCFIFAHGLHNVILDNSIELLTLLPLQFRSLPTQPSSLLHF